MSKFPEWIKGPFDRSKRDIFIELYNRHAKSLAVPFSGFGTMYENEGYHDTYGGWWAVPSKDMPMKDALIVAQAIQANVNAFIGYAFIAPPGVVSSNNDSNPYTADAIWLGFQPLHIAEHAQKYGNNSFVAAMREIAESGHTVTVDILPAYK